MEIYVLSLNKSHNYYCDIFEFALARLYIVKVCDIVNFRAFTPLLAFIVRLSFSNVFSTL